MFLELPFMYLQKFCAEQLGLYCYQNYIEVAVFTIIIYKTLRWLQQDHTKHLVLYVYAYAFTMIVSYLLSCTILFWTLLLLIPAITLLCIVLHQKQLQKNFILGSSKYVTPQTIPTKNWLELYVRSVLLASYQQKQIFCIIERSDQLSTLLHAPYFLHLPIQQNIMDLILSSTALQAPTIIWITQAGMINSVNVSWSRTLTEELLSTELLPTDAHRHHHALAHLLTQKTDAIIFSIDASTHLAMLWHQTASLQQITIDQLLTSCKQILYKNSNHELLNKSGVTYAAQNNTAHSSSKLH